MLSARSLQSVVIPSITAILVLDAETGSRVAVKYYNPPTPSPANPYPTLPAQLAFEKRLFAKLHRTQPAGGLTMAGGGGGSGVDVLPYETHAVVYKLVNDVVLLLVAPANENELLLYNALVALDEALASLFKGQVGRRLLIENLDLLLLTIDELAEDTGGLLEVDSGTIVQRVCMIQTGGGPGGGPGGVGGVGGGSGAGEVPLAEQSFTQALQTARDQFVKSFR